MRAPLASLCLPRKRADGMNAHMRKIALTSAALLALVSPVTAQDSAPPEFPSPNAIVEAAPQGDWVSIPSEEVLVMTLAPDRDGKTREVVIQLMPAPFSQGWVANIRTLARAEWYDGISINRVQDNYVVQWGDPGHDNPEGAGEAKPLPEGLNVMGEDEYSAAVNYVERDRAKATIRSARGSRIDNYAAFPGFNLGWPIAFDGLLQTPICVTEKGSTDCVPLRRDQYFDVAWPVHCYGMVGVGRSYSPDTGSGAELYTIIGHAPRHLDRNIALVGRVIEGIEHLSSLPRGSGALGFYTQDEAEKRVPILSIRVATDLAEEAQPASSSEAVGSKYAFEYLSTESESFATYAEARANRRDPFFIQPAGGADICNIPVPIRRVKPAQ